MGLLGKPNIYLAFQIQEKIMKIMVILYNWGTADRTEMGFPLYDGPKREGIGNTHTNYNLLILTINF